MTSGAGTRKHLIGLLSIAALVGLSLSFGMCIQDDAFISFRYARNLADGDGLVFNPGEPVEGYTNFLWTALLAPAFALELSPLLYTVLIGVASAAAAVAVAWVFTREDGPIAWAAPFFVALNLGLAMESVQGLETGLFAAWVGLALGLRARESPENGGWGSALAAGLAALTRPEGYLLFALLEGTGLLYDRAWRHRLKAWALFLAVTLPHLAFRVLYYGDIVPNTFHAKVGHTTAQALRGVHYLADFAASNVTLSALALIGLVVALRRRSSRLEALLPGIVLPWLLYVAYVGGDFKPTWRFVVPLLVPLAWLARIGLGALPRAGTRVGGLAWAAAALAGLSADTARGYPAFTAVAEYRLQVMEDDLFTGAFLRDTYPPTSVLAIHAAGAVPFACDFYTIDMWGLSDPHIARREVEGMGSGTAGHEKTDYDYVFSRDPDLYLPYEDYLTDEPKRLPVPTDFPADFEARYTQFSVPYEGRWINLFQRNDQEGGG